MTTHGMSLLMDGGGSMDVDVDNSMHAMDASMALDDVDLFGDPVMDNTMDLPVRPAPPSKQLQQRLDELRARGCCQGIAWSRQGTIASISKDRRSVELRFLSCRPGNGVWELSAPFPSSVHPLTPPAAQVVHLTWSATSSSELAIIDDVGRISIMNCSITINKLHTVRKWDIDPVDDLHAVVGCYWLPLIPPNRQYNIMYGPAVWNQTEYRYENSLTPAYGPFHPNQGRSALVCVTTNGLLKLLFSQNNNRIEETALEIESVTSSDDLITHASLCSDKHMLIIALATASKQLRVVQATIGWNLPSADKQAPPGSMTLRPTLNERHVAVTSWLQHGPSESPLDASMAQLSLIEMLPSAADRATSVVVSPLVLTVRSHLPLDNSPYNQECQSIIDRYEVLFEQQQNVHSAFDQLGPKHNSASPPKTTRLRKLDPIIVPKIVVSIHTMQLGRVICFAFSDGTVQYRERFTMNEVFNDRNANTISSLHQVGFQYTNPTPCLQVAFSPTNSSFVQVCEDWDVKWNSMQYSMEDPIETMPDNQYSAVLAALSVAISSAVAIQSTVIQQSNCDDILALARPFTRNPDFTYAWVRQMTNMLKVPVDYSDDTHHDSLMRNTHLQFFLSVLNHLGFQGEFQPRSFGGKFAMLALSVRNIVILVTIASNAPTSIKEKLNPLDEPEVVDALAGCSKWAVDLLSWLTDCLFQLADDPKFMSLIADPKRFPELAGYLRSQGDVSLHLLLCSSTRGFLSAACRRLMHLDAISQRATYFYENKAQLQRDADPAGTAPRPPSALFHAYQKLQRYTSSSLIKIPEFEKLVSSLSNDIRAAYQTSLSGLVAKGGGGRPQNQGNVQQQGQGQGQQGANNGTSASDQFIKKAQMHCELDMLLAANPPPCFREVLVRFFGSSLPAFRAQTDPAKLYFGNYTLLEVDDDPKSLAARRSMGRYIDVFKRVELFNNGRVSSLKGNQPMKNAASGAGHANGHSEGAVPMWRRCVRCASVMEDVYGQRPGFVFVLGQQRKCPCMGSWGLLPRSTVHP
ncbi:mediator complex, subunit Med16 [Podospora appendiculata]|uniref:Mediator of RNA polymerase II transcription subunit 16 n=1 Tax=Podospora appendiculata TaxID=314037 RepID=A0AAE0XJI8_9PEZI|nr:mediator complex, subunit Med16 [Podospora appendiculata]